MAQLTGSLSFAQACARNHTAVVKYLLDQKADVRMRDRVDDFTCVHAAAVCSVIELRFARWLRWLVRMIVTNMQCSFLMVRYLSAYHNVIRLQRTSDQSDVVYE